MDAISVTEAAGLLGLTRRQVNSLIADGRLPAKRIGNFNIIKRSDLAKVKPRRRGRPPKKRPKN